MLGAIYLRIASAFVADTSAMGLPIAGASAFTSGLTGVAGASGADGAVAVGTAGAARSEERRVGKEC